MSPVNARMWGVLGVRFCHFYVNYEAPPYVRYGAGEPWEECDLEDCDTAKSVIAVLEFAEFQLSGSRTLTREEFRSVCDQYDTKAEIVAALEAY